MNAKTLMLAAALGLAGNAMAEGTQDPAKKAEKHAKEAETEAGKAADAAEKAQQQGQQQAQGQPDAAAQAEMEAMMAQEIERRVSAAETAPEKRVFGKIIGFEEEQVIIDIGGAALPLAVNHETKIEGEAIPKTRRINATLKNELKPGQLVSITYDLKQMENVALTIEELKADANMGAQQPSPMGAEPQPGSTGMESEPAPSAPAPTTPPSGSGTSDY